MPLCSLISSWKRSVIVTKLGVSLVVKVVVGFSKNRPTTWPSLPAYTFRCVHVRQQAIITSTAATAFRPRLRGLSRVWVHGFNFFGRRSLTEEDTCLKPSYVAIFLFVVCWIVSFYYTASPYLSLCLDSDICIANDRCRIWTGLGVLQLGIIDYWITYVNSGATAAVERNFMISDFM